MPGRQLLDFPGGLALEGHRAPSAGGAAVRLPLPAVLRVPLLQHVGRPARVSVAVGDRVAAGAVIGVPDSYVGAPVHAPAAGRVTAVEDGPVAHQRVAVARTVIIETDGERPSAAAGAPVDVQGLSPEEIVTQVRDAGVVGLGGAGFPAHVKLAEGGANPVELLVVNGVECEPFITCDDCLIRERCADVVAGAALVARAVGAERTVIAVEDDMPEAFAALADAITASGAGATELVSVPSRYPAGGEKQLIYALTGRHVPAAGLPLDVGVVMHNVGTVVAALDAVVHGRVLVERIVTVTGAVAKPQNLLVPIGTTVETLIEACGGVSAASARVILGGPMMGVDVDDLRTPITKTTNCVLVMERTEAPEERPCIRCGDCVGVCPAGLQPQALLQASLSADYDEAQDFHLFECIECGLCAYVCPSAIPLVHHYRHAKSVIESMDADHDAAGRARMRAELRAGRLEPEQLPEDETALVEVTAASRSALRDEVAAAVARRRADDE